MENIFIIAAVISVVFLIVKFLEMRLIEKESKPLKLLIRDALLVYCSVVAGNFVMEQINPVFEGGKKATPVFTDNPGF
jgi:heme/copper-type cytochrome/quinol oxidase subunit 4